MVAVVGVEEAVPNAPGEEGGGRVDPGEARVCVSKIRSFLRPQKEEESSFFWQRPGLVSTDAISNKELILSSLSKVCCPSDTHLLVHSS